MCIRDRVNTITTAVNSALMNYHVISKDAIPTSNLIQGIIIAALVALILLGGVKRIAQVTEKLVPFMALFYIVLAIGVILLNLNRIPSVFVSILELSLIHIFGINIQLSLQGFYNEIQKAAEEKMNTITLQDIIDTYYQRISIENNLQNII